MKGFQVAILALVLAAIFAVTYSPHYSYSFPLHIDEWHHISQALRIGNGEYIAGVFAYEIGFHVILYIISLIIPLLTIYPILPATWAAISALTLFFTIFLLQKKYIPAIMSAIFFASIKSNVFVTGTWFFTPLSFAIPFIYLYLYLFTIGCSEKSIKHIYIAIAIMSTLLLVHPLSTLFTFPAILIYLFLHRDFVRKNILHFCSLLALPITGILLYLFVHKGNLSLAMQNIIAAVTFTQEWAVFLYNITPFELYSSIGFILATLGITWITTNSQALKKYSLYLLVLLSLIVSMIVYQVTGISLMIPYQRTVMYFLLILSVFSGLGVYFVIKYITALRIQRAISLTIVYGLILLVCLCAFLNYWETPRELKLYYAVDQEDNQTIEYLRSFEGKLVFSEPLFASVIYPLTNNYPFYALNFYNIDRKPVYDQFINGECAVKNKIIHNYNIDIVVLAQDPQCNWQLLHEYDLFVFATENSTTIKP